MSSAVVDLMSSPDPLIEAVVPSSTAPFTKRITRSQRIQRFASLSQSPRKRTFELDVGNERSPQKILVTVQAEGSEREAGVNRRLFASPTPRSAMRRQAKTITTSVPLKGLTDDESEMLSGTVTPRKRGRPRASRTPTPATRKRTATPMQGTPRPTRRARLASEDPASEMSTASDQAIPKSATRTRKTPLKRAATPAKAKEVTPAQSSQPRKRGRPRRQELAPEEIEELPDQEVTESTIIVSDPSVSSIDDPPASAAGDDVQSSIGGDDVPSADAFNDHMDDDEDEEDIWLVGLPEPPIRRQFSEHHQPGPSAPIERTIDRVEARSSSPGFARSEVDDLPQASTDADPQSEAVSLMSEEIAPSVGGQDTIVNGEDFSMISFDTMQSFHANSSMHEAALPEMGEMTSLIVSRTLESLRNSQTQQEQPIFELPSTDGAAPTSSPPKDSPNTEAVSHKSDGPLFSQPASPQTWARSPRRSRAQPLSRQVALKSLQKSDAPSSPQVSELTQSPERTPRADNSRQAAEELSMYEDSFSEIPEAVLEAATPRRPSAFRSYEEEDFEAVENDVIAPEPDVMENEDDMGPDVTAVMENGMDVDDDEAGGDADIDADVGEDVDYPPEESPSRSRPPSRGSITSSTHRADSESNRLPTPDETPSPAENALNTHQGKLEQSTMLQSSPLRSSPPISAAPLSSGAWSFAQHSRQNASVTPPRLASSPHLPPAPPGNAASDREDSPSVPSSSSRPALSPIRRAGRALQSVTSDPPSPGERESVLGSPFRSSVGRPTPSPGPMQREVTAPVESPRVVPPTPVQQQHQPPSAPPSERSWARAFAPLSSLKKLVVQGTQVFSPRAAAPAADPEPSPIDAERSAEEILLAVSQYSDSPTRSNVFAANSINSTRAQVPSDDDEMEWEVDPSPPPAPAWKDTQRDTISSSLFGTRGSTYNRLQEEEEDADMEQSLPQNLSPHGDDDDEEEEEEDEDIWAIEARRSMDTAPKAAVAPAASVLPPRRGKLPSPWRQNSKKFLYSDEVARNAAAAANEEPSRADEFSMISVQAAKEVPTVPQDPAPRKKIDLSSFFSSPAVLPKMQPPTTQRPPVPTQPQVIEKPVEPSPQPDQTTPVLHQKRFQFRDRTPSLVQKPSEQSILRASVLNQSFRPTSSRNTDLFALGEPEQQEPEPSAVRNDPIPVPPSTPDRSSFAHVAQKQNFTPQQGSRAGGSLFQSPTKQVAPNLLSGRKTIGFGASQSAVEGPGLKPLPEKTASPTKSCLRSPLKPKTPGRVVEFTSSTLSPLAQAQQRVERTGQHSGLATWGQDFAASTSSQRQQPVQVQAQAQTQTQTALSMPGPSVSSAEMDKENTPAAANGSAMKKTQPQRHHNISTFSSSLLAGTPRTTTTVAAPLSQTSWTRAHWVRLDELLQERRCSGPLNFQLKHATATVTAARGGSSSSSSTALLLGKQVAAQGETLTLEQWHLDVVDAFAAELGGSSVWDGSVLAKRLFALIVGDERRRLGLVPKRRAGGNGIGGMAV